VLCDAVHRDRATGKSTILGTFSAVSAAEFPTSFSLSVYYAITDAKGEFPVTFRIVDSAHAFDDQSEPVLQFDTLLRSPNPLAVHEGVIRLSSVTLQEPGVYHCELLHGEELLMSRRLVAIRPADLEADHGKDS
jgi:hypothetical protein